MGFLFSRVLKALSSFRPVLSLQTGRVAKFPVLPMCFPTFVLSSPSLRKKENMGEK